MAILAMTIPPPQLLAFNPETLLVIRIRRKVTEDPLEAQTQLLKLGGIDEAEGVRRVQTAIPIREVAGYLFEF